MQNITAHDFQSDHFFDVAIIGRSEWECLGYSRSGQTIKFARLVEGGRGLRQISIYLRPDKIVGLLTPAQPDSGDAPEKLDDESKDAPTAG